MTNRTLIVSMALLACLTLLPAGEPTNHKTERPFIWVDRNERAEILKTIETHQWATAIFTKMKESVDKDLLEYDKDVDAYLRKLPFDWKTVGEGKHPQFLYVTDRASEKNVRYPLMHYLQSGIESGILYYLTEEAKYGQYSADILHAVVEAMARMEIPQKSGGNGGYVFVKDHLKEARVFGAQIPILYDFTKPFLDKGGKPYSLVKKKNVPFNNANAQKVFANYAYLALNRGGKHTNWPVLEGSSLIHNTLALDDLKLREKYLKIIVDKGNKNHDSIRETAQFFDQTSGIWPESLQYAGGVASGTTYHMAVLTKYNPSWKLPQKYPHIVMALFRTIRLQYPNGRDVILFGDGHRRGGGVSMGAAEMGYFIGTTQGLAKAKEAYGDAIVTAMKGGGYDRSGYSGRSNGASAWKAPLALLWRVPKVEGRVKAKATLPTTDDLPFAGIYLQRNLSPSKDPKDALMSFVGGAGFVHGHASGMNMELYCAGEVLGSKGGRAGYVDPIHVNYYRLFAGHNTVVVNGESRGGGGWANLKINTVKLVAMEPRPRKKAVSANHSFTLTSFRDDKGDKARADQQRLMAIVRTSPTSGYYVDVFRSRSEQPKQYHDYIYHGVSDGIVVETEGVSFSETPERFQGSAKKKWKKNRSAQDPGWHYFTDVKTARHENDLNMLFPVSKLDSPASMRMYLVAERGREVTTVLAPPTFECPKAYLKKPTPTVVVRQTGDAWDRPFAMIYEPIKNGEGRGAIESVKRLVQDGRFCGFEVVSQIGGNILKQFVVIPNGKPVLIEDVKLSFDGTYAVVSVLDGRLDSMYVGHGRTLSCGTSSLSLKTPGGASLTLLNGNPSVSGDGPGTLTVDGKSVEFGE